MGAPIRARWTACATSRRIAAVSLSLALAAATQTSYRHDEGRPTEAEWRVLKPEAARWAHIPPSEARLYELDHIKPCCLGEPGGSFPRVRGQAPLLHRGR